MPPAEPRAAAWAAGSQQQGSTVLWKACTLTLGEHLLHQSVHGQDCIAAGNGWQQEEVWRAEATPLRSRGAAQAGPKPPATDRPRSECSQLS